MIKEPFRPIRSCGRISATMLGLILLLGVYPASAERSERDFVIYDTPKPITELAFVRGNGSDARLADFRGKHVLLNIWATWCLPCRKEMPTLDRLQSELGGADFEVVALSIDRAGVDAVRKFYRKTGIENLNIYVDKSMKTLRILKIRGLPTTLFIDKEGREAGRLIGPAGWDSPGMITFLRSHIGRSIITSDRP